MATPPPAPAVVVKKEEDSRPISPTTSADKMDCDEGASALNGGGGGATETNEEEEKVPPTNGDAMEEDDYVVAENDVYCTPSNADTQLYVFQYPLRPSWRPYELDQRCTEVRVKPKSAKVEVDMSIDKDSDNYDPNAPSAQKMGKQTLSSAQKPPQVTGYAVGVLMGTKLYVNPIHAVVQLRPSMGYLDSGSSKKRNAPEIAAKAEGPSSVVPVGSSGKQSQQMDPEETESWVPLKYHSSTSDLSERYLRKMVKEENHQLEFQVTPYDYLNSLCPGTAINKMKSRGPSRRYLLSLPLEERLKTWLVEGPPVQRFSALKHLAPDDPVEEVLRLLQKHSLLVQGLWVVKTKTRNPNASGNEQLVRDYALLLFSQSPVIKDSKFDVLGSHKSSGKAVIREIAVERPSCKDWKFKESTDVSFMKLYPDVVEQQRKQWQDAEKGIMEYFSRRKPGATLESSRRAERIGNLGSSVQSDSVITTNSTHRGRMSMSKETREALPKVLRKLFQSHKVCSFQTIRQGLRDMAVSMSTLPKADARAVVAAALSVDGPHEELQAVISEVAVNVHGVYVLKSSSEHPEFNPLRNVVIELFLGSGRNSKLKKSEIIEAAKSKLQRVPTNAEFQKVITEICVSKGGAWMLKSGDGVPN